MELPQCIQIHIRVWLCSEGRETPELQCEAWALFDWDDAWDHEKNFFRSVEKTCNPIEALDLVGNALDDDACQQVTVLFHELFDLNGEFEGPEAYTALNKLVNGAEGDDTWLPSYRRFLQRFRLENSNGGK